MMRLPPWSPDSKAVDASGAPLVLYHGTAAAFTQFAENPRGIFFAEDIAQAAPFSRIRRGTPRVIAANLSIKNPWQMVRYADDVPYSQMIDQSISALRARGYDGIHAPDDKVWIVFDADQIHQLEAETDDMVDDATESLLEAPGHG
jgi:hypothetical protein